MIQNSTMMLTWFSVLGFIDVVAAVVVIVAYFLHVETMYLLVLRPS